MVSILQASSTPERSFIRYTLPLRCSLSARIGLTLRDVFLARRLRPDLTLWCTYLLLELDRTRQIKQLLGPEAVGAIHKKSTAFAAIVHTVACAIGHNRRILAGDAAVAEVHNIVALATRPKLKGSTLIATFCRLLSGAMSFSTDSLYAE